MCSGSFQLSAWVLACCLQLQRLFIVLLVFVLLLLPLFILVVLLLIFLSLLPLHLLVPLIIIIEESFPSRSCLWSFPFPLSVCPGSRSHSLTRLSEMVSMHFQNETGECPMERGERESHSNVALSVIHHMHWHFGCAEFSRPGGRQSQAHFLSRPGGR